VARRPTCFRPCAGCGARVASSTSSCAIRRIRATSKDAARAARGYKGHQPQRLQSSFGRAGLLATFSCSGGVSADLFQKIIAGAAPTLGHRLLRRERYRSAPTIRYGRVPGRRVFEGLFAREANTEAHTGARLLCNAERAVMRPFLGGPRSAGTSRRKNFSARYAQITLLERSDPDFREAAARAQRAGRSNWRHRKAWFR